MPDHQELAGLVGEIYDAATEPGKWSVFLERLAQVFRADFGGVGAIDWKRRESPFSATYQLDPMGVEEWLEYSFKSADWIYTKSIFELKGKPISCRLVAGDREIQNNSYFQEFLAPLGVEYLLSVILETAPDVTVCFFLYRRSDSGFFSQDDCDRFGELIPHFRRAYEIHDRLSKARFVEETTRGVLDNLPAAILIVDGDARVSFANATARKMEAHGRGISTRHGFFWAEQSQDTRELRRVLKELESAAEGGNQPPGKGLSFSRQGQRPLAVMVSPLEGTAIKIERSAWHAAVFLTDPDLRYEGNVELLQRLYGVTHAEGEVLDELVAGRNLREIAEGRSVAEGTVRKQLKAILSKTNSRSQSELIALVLQHPAWLRHQSTTQLV